MRRINQAQTLRVSDVMVAQEPPRRRRKLSRADVITRALAIIDANGLEACTMMALARGLGVTPRALYRHITDKTDLLAGVADRVLSDMRLPDENLLWRDQITSIATELRSVLCTHPAAASLCARRATVFPAVIPIIDVLIRAFAAGNLPPRDAIAFGHVLFNYVVGFSLSEVDHIMNDDQDSQGADPMAGLSMDKLPFAMRHADDIKAYVTGGQFASDRQFSLGLSLLIAGLDANQGNKAP
ncbi:TetR/AcrR family transcriptional regulator C-terminal domain-containing protein [Thalassospira sp. MA62]|nr:TetR/AcrR family transcriptional regulator C-terminal domain-containing protein [Thalassospira sp. MA62]